MKNRAIRRPLQIVTENGEPSAVILSIEEYREMLEKLEDLEDLKLLDEMRQKPLKCRKLEEFLEEYSPRA